MRFVALPAAMVTLSAPALAQTVALVAEQRLVSPASVDLPFELTGVPADQQVRLALLARCDHPVFGGHNPFLAVKVNGRVVEPWQLLNKPREFTMYDGSDAGWWGQGMWRLLYSPSFAALFRDDPPAYMVADADPYRFVWDITPYVTAGRNTVTLSHPKLLTRPTTVVVAEVGVEVGQPQAPARQAADGGEAGELMTYVAQPARAVPMAVRLGSGGALEVTVGDRRLAFTTRVSEPEGRWGRTSADRWSEVLPAAPGVAAWTGNGYRVERRVTVAADHVRVADTITNTTDRLLGAMVEHRLELAAEPHQRLLCGRKVHRRQQTTASPANPTALARWPELAVGLVAVDDLFRVQGECFSTDDAIGLADRRLGFAPGAAHTLEWSIHPAPGGDYWDVINAIRRDWGSNFTIPGPSVFEPTPDGSRSGEDYARWLSSRHLSLAVAGQQRLDDGILAEGTAIPLAHKWNAGFRRWRARLKAADPSFQALIYLHTQISTEPEAQTKYPDCRVLDSGGQQVVSPYHYPVYLFLPRPDNAYGRELMKTVEFILDELPCDGIYNDCFHYDSAAWAWGLPWDGCTVSIDPQTHAVGERYSSVVLLQQPFKEWLVEAVRRRGKLLIGNGVLKTRTMLKHQVPTFTETNSFAFLIDTHLGAPWGLGTHESEQSPRARAYMARRMLDHGGVYSVYVWSDDPAEAPFIRHFYPITPTELRAGVVMGEERILTSRSGRFGWPDGARAEVHVYDAEGRPVPEPLVSEVKDGSRWLTEVRLPVDGFAALVRRR